MEHELQQMEHFSVIRSEMECRINKVAKEIQRKYAKANALDLVIVMDCTGSMAPWIEEAKAAIISVIDNIKTDHSSAHVRVGFVVYRDFCDHNKRIQTHALSSDVAAVKEFVASLEAFGGGDGPEDIPGGLEAALAMPFQVEAKRIVVVVHATEANSTTEKTTWPTTIRSNKAPTFAVKCEKWRRVASTFPSLRSSPAAQRRW